MKKKKNEAPIRMNQHLLMAVCIPANNNTLNNVRFKPG